MARILNNNFFISCSWTRLFVTTCGYAVMGMRGIQPERLNAEGDSPSALSRGLSVRATPGKPSSPRKASGGRECCRRGKWYSRSSHHGGRDYTEGYASLHPRLRATRCARAFDLSGRAAVNRVVVCIFGVDLWVGWGCTTLGCVAVGVVMTINRALGGRVAVGVGGYSDDFYTVFRNWVDLH